MGLAVVAVPVVVLLVLAGVLALALRSFDEHADDVAAAIDVRQSVADVRALVVDLETGARGFRLTGDQAFLEPFEAARDRLPGALARLRSSVAADAGQTARVARLDEAVAERERVSAEIIALPFTPEGAAQVPALLAAGKRSTDGIRALLDRVDAVQRRALADANAGRADAEDLATLAIVAAVVVAALAGFGASLAFSHGVVARVARLEEMADAIAAGQEVPEPPAGRDEVARVGSALVHLRDELATRDEQLRLAIRAGRILLFQYDADTGTVHTFGRQDAAGDEPILLDAVLVAAHPEDQAAIRAALEAAAAGERVEDLEFRIGADGSRWAALSAQQNSRLGARVATGVTVDITSRKRVEEALQAALAEVRDLYDTAPIGYHSLDEHGRYLWLNRTEQEWLGYREDEVVGRMTFRDLLTPASQARFDEEYPRFREQGEAHDLEFDVRRRDGSTFRALVNAIVVRDPDGRFASTRSTLVDITARAEADRRLREAEAFLESVVENLPLVVYVKNAADLRFLRLNRTAEELFGVDRATVIGRTDRDLYPPEVAAAREDRDRAVLAGDAVHDGPPEPVRTKDREVRMLHTRRVPIRDGDGTPRYLLAIAEDVTERIAADEALHEAVDDAQRANRAKSAFLSRMSHELRTPLNSVLGFAQLLELDPLTEEQRESVEYILKAGRHLLELINDVLDISRIETGRLGLSVEPVALGPVVHDAVESIRPLAAQRGLALHGAGSDGDGESPLAGLFVLADRRRLTQVLLNLLSNAVKYTPPGGRVDVLVAQTGDRVSVSVRDTGPGIAPEHLERLFQPFERLGAEESGVEGTGIGLALARGLARAMGGTLEVETAPGSGSTFTVVFAAADAPVGAPVEDRSDAGGAGDDETVVVPGSTGVIVYVEDNAANLELVARALRTRPDVRLLTATTAGEGIALVQQHVPGLVLLDVHLPDGDGREVLRALRGDPRTADIPVVALSADATAAQRRAMLDGGAIEYLTKPLDLARLTAIVDDILGA